jgi:hypothetical protein
MNEAEWIDSNDAGAMLEFLWLCQGIQPCAIDLRSDGKFSEPDPRQSDFASLERQLHQFYLACCRAIWKLLPQEESRRGVELAERYLDGKVTDEELSKYNWYVEGAAFNIDYNCKPEAIRRWVEEVRRIPEMELRSMLHPPDAALAIEPRKLLLQAAYFADFAMIYPTLTPKGPPPTSYYPFLSANSLRKFVGNPFPWTGDST